MRSPSLPYHYLLKMFNSRLNLPDNFSTLVDLLGSRALYQPEQIAYTFLKDVEDEEISLNYQELEQKARAVGTQLQSLGASRQRALLLYPPGLEYIAAFFGCLYAGVIAVPAYPPRQNKSLSRLQSVAADAQATVALTTTTALSNIKGQLTHLHNLTALQSLHWLTTDDINIDLADSWQQPQINSDSLAFLQYTSGSTGTPKGVMVSHGNLLQNLASIYQCFGHSPKSQGVIWLPPYHDMGLIGGVLQPLYGGFPVTLMSPVNFLQKPFHWLEAISRYKATTSGGPNFAYDLCVRKITPEQRETLDLSSWEVAFNGAEPIRAETLKKFAETFEPCGFRASSFYPCYGMAETTLIVSGGLKTAPPILKTVKGKALEQNQVVPISWEEDGAQMLVGCGQTLPGQQIIIAHPDTLTLCSPNEVGEIWVSGSSVGQGYWNQPKETAQNFQAYLSDTKEGPFLRTGDLGFLLDGELFVTGRLKDLIIIRGRNYYPQDIELTVEQSHPALRLGCGAAFSVELYGEEQLVIAQEVERSYLRNLNVDEVVGAIRQAVAEQYELQVYAVLLLKTGSISKTSSGKIQRYACWKGFLAGDLELVGDWTENPRSKAEFLNLQAEVESLYQQLSTDKHQRFTLEKTTVDETVGSLEQTQTAEAIQAWLVSKISGHLKVAPDVIDIRETFSRYGLDSVTAVGLSGELEKLLGRRLSPTLVYDYPTIKALARHLAKAPDDSASTLEVNANQETKKEAIAIIGLGCRFPGAKDPESFWQLLRDGIDAITEVPAERWDVDTLYDLDSAKSEKMNTRWGGFLKEVDQFDPHFFGISPREAELMDPQQRLLLEVAWEALENAGQSPDKLAGSQTGVFIGISSSDYSRLHMMDDDFTRVKPYVATGNAFSIAANRLSYVLDLRGPSLAVDTACSSSLTALHLAFQSLSNGECNLALAGGVNLILSPELTIAFSQAQMMAADGRCKTFDAEADGYVRGEGCGLVVLKRLSDALRDKDNILALVRGSAVNQDGHSNGITAPNGSAQQAVIRQALKTAGVSPAQISYVEAHGTGTSLGDPIEVESLKAVLIQDRLSNQPCVIGSVKTNIGHLEAAAGIASLIKVVLSLQHSEIPPHLHLKKLNPYISLENTSFLISTKRQPWQAGTERRLAGVSSFGFGGTNAHVVLEEAPTRITATGDVERPLHMLTLSAQSRQALQTLACRYQVFLATQPALSLVDICFTANVGRAHFEHRLVITTESATQLREQLEAFVAGKPTTGLVSGQVRNRSRPKIAFLFTGQGSQYPGMGRQLYDTQPTFRQALERCEELLRPHLEQPLLSVLYPDTGVSLLLEQTAYIQPALFALEYALYQLWLSWGVQPDVVLGHSMGEYVAACVAGVFSLEDGLQLVAARGRLMQALPCDGVMVAMLADEPQVSATIAPYASEVTIAAVNGPRSLVISGRQEAVQAVVVSLQAQGVKTKQLQVSHAFHSPLMAPMLGEFEQVAAQVSYLAPRLKFISNLTGQVAGAEVATPEYWCRHILSPVQFAASFETLQQHGYEVFVEVGPQPTLLGMGQQCLAAHKRQLWLPSMRMGQEDWQQLLQSVAQLYIRGVAIDWQGLHQDYPQRRRVVLPTYPFQRQRFWVDSKTHKQPKQDASPTRIMQLLQQGDVAQLTQQLATELSTDEVKDLPKLLEVLVRQHQQEFNTALIKDWLYQVEWQQQPRTSQAAAETSLVTESSWLILADQRGVGEILAQRLQQQGQKCFVVYPGESYQQQANNTWSLNPSAPNDYQRLLQEVAAASTSSLKGVMHLWSLETAGTDELTIPRLEQAQVWGCASVLHLVQALVQPEWRVAPRLWLVTQGAMPVAGSLPDVAQAPLWGLGKVVALEHPEFWGGLLDLAPESTEEAAAEGLLTEIQDALGEDQLAFRLGQRYVARLVPSQLPAPLEVQFRADSTYLITGGLGALGLKIAQWMVAKGARNLVLIGRRGATPEGQQALSQIEQTGAKVRVVQADVSVAEDMVRVLADIKACLPPLKGILHAAGVAAYQAMKDIDLQALQSVLRPKVLGTWILHQLTQDIKLDFFIGFSSIASVWGSKGQAHYAAANHFLDSLAYYRQGLGLPALSVNWGPWAEGGMASKEAQEWLTRMGVKALRPNQAFTALGVLLQGSSPQNTVAHLDWTRFKGIYEARKRRLLLERIEAPLQEATKQHQEQQSKVLQQLEAVQESDRQDLLIAYLQAEVAKVLKLSQLPELQQGFFEMGMDSLMAIELKDRLETSLCSSLPATLAFESPTIKDLADYLGREILGWNSLVTDATEILQGKDKQAVALAKVAGLSEDEVETSIAERLAQLESLLKAN